MILAFLGITVLPLATLAHWPGEGDIESVADIIRIWFSGRLS